VSDAEERIRLKVEYALRQEFPDARIVHELKMASGLVRLDMAAVRSAAITVVEIKSERDTLKRLKSQIGAALEITGDVRLYTTDKHRTAIERHADPYETGPDGHWAMTWTENGGRGQGRCIPNPDHIPDLHRVRVLIEGDTGFEPLTQMWAGWWDRQISSHMPDTRAMLEVLWAEELHSALLSANIAHPPRSNRAIMKHLALNYMTGSAIRTALCNALRNRPFARADKDVA
jgi:hypothetical protein